MSRSKGKLKSLTLKEKLKLIELVENGKSVKDTAEEQSINKNTLHYILKHRDKIRNKLCENPNVSDFKRIKDTKSPELQERILSFMYESRRRNEKLSSSSIKAYALEVAAELGVGNFVASNGWLFSFFKRNRIVMSEFNKGIGSGMQGESVYESAEVTAATEALTNEEIVYEEEQGLQDEPVEVSIEETTASETFVKGEIVYEEENDFQNYDVIETLDDAVTSDEEFDSTQEQAVLENQIQDFPWNHWCRLCGALETTVELDLQNETALKKTLNISSDIIPTCEECSYSVNEMLKMMSKAKLVEYMIRDLEELETLNCLTTDELTRIRQRFIDDHEDYSINDINEEVDEAVYLKLEQQSEQSDSGEIVYESVVSDEIEIFEDHIKTEVEVSPHKLPPTSKRSEIEDSFIYKCHVCDVIFERMCFLTNHTRIEHSCLPKVVCSCGRTLSTWDSLMAHKRKHTSHENTFVCDLCNDASFKTKTGLTIHMKFKHEKQITSNNDCTICGRQFGDKSRLKAHKRTHLPQNEKYPFECDVCGKKMVSKWSLKHHVAAIHEKLIKHFCHICGRGFVDKSNLRSHLISHSTENVSCNICGGVFKNRVSLQSHKRIHKPESMRNFSCHICQRRYLNQNHLRRHMISHSEERAFKCPYELCLNEYKWQKDLNNHIAGVHKGERPHKCMFCERSFVDAANLRKHKVKDHPEELVAFESEFGKGRNSLKSANRTFIVKYEAE